MGEVMMVEKQNPVLDDADLPLFYMNDFSVLGLVVPKLSKALNLLEASGYQVAHKKGCARIQFRNRLELKALFQILNRHHVAYGTADLVTHAYQG